MALDRFKFERAVLKLGVSRVAGTDEAGRGPLAGPVVAAAVQLPLHWIQEGLPRKLRGLNDSKQLDKDEREKFFKILTEDSSVCYAYSVISPEVIDMINILQASLRAMNESLAQLAPGPEHTLVDGPHISTIKHPQTPIIDGDARSYSIAAASVIAKVIRDRIMVEYHAQFPDYGFDEHKGYSTPRHLAALQRHGPCAIHRRSFAPIRARDPELFSQT
ncbi:MAG: Ribonuclease [Verrucomicrobiales bacterium]|jgi:ribonuclease HII|nr:Ribonuclease [Verrucomicrobiales bacterium]